MKKKWNELKENISNIIKLFLLFFLMINGFFLIYAVVWFAVGLPQTNWAIALIYGIATLSEYGYYRWLRE